MIKENLTIVGVVLMIFGMIFFGSIGPSNDILSSQIAFIIGSIFIMMGFIIVTICHSLSLSIGIALLLFEFIRVISANALICFQDPYISHYGRVGSLYISIGGPLVIYLLLSRSKK